MLIDWIDFIEDEHFDWKIKTLLSKIDIFDINKVYKENIKRRII